MELSSTTGSHAIPCRSAPSRILAAPKAKPAVVRHDPGEPARRLVDRQTHEWWGKESEVIKTFKLAVFLSLAVAVVCVAAFQANVTGTEIGIGVLHAQGKSKDDPKKDAPKKDDPKKDAKEDPKKPEAPKDGEQKPAAGEEGGEGDAPAAGEGGDEAAWQALRSEWAASLKSSEWAIRKKAVDAYAKSNHPQAALALTKVLNDRKAPLAQAQYYYVLEKLGEFTSQLSIRTITRAMTKWTGSDQVYDNYLVLKGFAKADSAEVNGEVSRLVTSKDTTNWIKAAALEAMAESRKPHYIGILMDFISEVGAMWDNEDAILPISAMNAIGRCYEQPKTAAERLPLLRRFRDMLDVDKGGFRNDRVRYWVATTFADVAKMPVPTEDLWWIDWYLLEIEKGTVGPDGKAPEPPPAPEGRHSTRQRMEFIGMPAIGRRVVFCLDLSLSMNEEIDPAIIEAAKARERAPKPSRTGEGRNQDGEKEEDKIDWENIKTKLDLAKAYLLRSLDQFARVENQRVKELEEWKKEGRPGRTSRTRGRSVLEEPYMFNIVLYATKVNLLDPETKSFVPATDREIGRFKKLVQDYAEGEGMTNIHGALLEGFRITEGKKVEGDPALDSTALLKGADTVFFMTDGWASWSDDSTDYAWDERKKNPPPTQKAIGNGKYIYAEDILTDFDRLNRFRKVTVNTVGIGNHDRPLMMGMAMRSRGQYVDFSGKKPLGGK